MPEAPMPKERQVTGWPLTYLAKESDDQAHQG